MSTICEMARKKPDTVPVSVRLLRVLRDKLQERSDASQGLLSVSYFINEAVDLYVNGPKPEEQKRSRPRKS